MGSLRGEWPAGRAAPRALARQSSKIQPRAKLNATGAGCNAGANTSGRQCPASQAEAISAMTGDLKVYSTIGVRSAVEQLVPQMEKVSGRSLAITWGTAPMLVKRIEGGETADVLILNR